MVDKAPPLQVRIGSCAFDQARAELLGPNGEPVHLRPRAMRVLEVLLAQAGRVVTRDDLIAAVWPGLAVTDDSLVQCIGDIRRALGADHTLLRTLPRLGYRLDVPPVADAAGARPPDAAAADPLRPNAGPITVPTTQPTASPGVFVERRAIAAAGPAALAPAARAWIARRRALFGAAAVVLLAALGWLIADGGDPIAAALPGHRSPGAGLPAALAVRIVHDAAGAAQQEQAAAWAAGMAEQLAADLVRNTDLIVVPVPATETDTPPMALARRLATRYIADGRVQLRPTGWQLTTRLIDGSTGAVLWTDSRESTLTGQHAEREALLRRIAQATHASMRLDQGVVALPAPPVSIEVHQLVLRARARLQRFDRDEYRLAHDELQQAIAREPGYALAWAVLGYLDASHASARISGDLSDTRRAELIAQADRALALDPGLMLAQQARALALVNAARAAEAVRVAEAALKRSALDPRNEWVLANALVADGRMAEALRATARARSRYLVTPAEFDFVRAKVLWGNDQFDEAVEAASHCLEKVPQFVACRAIRALASDGMGRLEAAREDLKKYRVAVPGAPTHALGPGSYGVPKLQNDWLADIRSEIGLP